MAIIWLLIMTVVLAAYGFVTFTFGADTRSGADGSGALGRRTHQPETWW